MFNTQLVKQSDVNRVTAALRSVLRTEFPDVNTEEGSNVGDLLLRPMGYLAALLKAQADDVRSRLSLQGIKDSRVTDSFTMLQDLASNFLVFPKDAVPAKGVVTFKFTNNVSRTIPSNILLTRGDDTVVVKPFDTTSNITITSSDYVEIEEEGTTFYLYTELFESVNTQDDLEIIAGTFQSSTTIANLDSIFNTSNFIRQSPSEFRESSLERRIALALTARTFITDRGIRAVLEEEGITNLKGSIGIGAGDPEMQRDIIPSSLSSTEFHSLGMVNVVLKTNLEEAQYALTDANLPNKPIVASMALTRSGTNLSVVSLWDYSTTQKVKVTRLYNTSGNTTCSAALVDINTTLGATEVSLTISDSSLAFKNGVASAGKFTMSVGSGQSLPTTGLFKVDNNLEVVQQLISSNEYATLANNTLAISANLVQVFIPLISVKLATGIDSSAISTADIKSRLGSIINTWAEDQAISLIDLLTPLSVALAGIATSIEFTNGIDYLLYLPNGKEILYSSPNQLSVEDVTKQKVANTTTSDYLKSLQVSDRVLSYFIESEDITVEVS